MGICQWFSRPNEAKLLKDDPAQATPALVFHLSHEAPEWFFVLAFFIFIFKYSS